MKRKIRFLVSSVFIGAFLLVFLLVSFAYAAALTVDTFNDGGWPEQVDSEYCSSEYGVEGQTACAGPGCSSPHCFPSSNTYDGAEILGGERDIAVINVTGSGRAFLNVDRRNNDEMSFVRDSGVLAVAAIVWDGDEGDDETSERADTIDLDGLGGVDLTGGGLFDGFLVGVTFDNRMTEITIEVYSNTIVATSVLPLLGGLDDRPERNRQDVFLPFADFDGESAVFASAGAIVLRIDGSLEAANIVQGDYDEANRGIESGYFLNVDSFEVANVREYGDLPAAYGTAITTANHIPLGLSLGNNVDTEGDGNTVGNATGDDTAGNPDDEDGVRPTPGVNWAPGAAGGSVDVTVEGCGSGNTCRLNGWIDWDNDNDFDESGDLIFDDMPVDDGVVNTSFSFEIPAGTIVENNSFYARFRICRGTDECNSVTAQNVSDGEIEDYLWGFGPTAITLSSFAVNSVDSSSNGVALTAAGVFSLGVIGSVFVSRRRKK